MKISGKKVVIALIILMLAGGGLMLWTPTRATLLSAGVSAETRGYRIAEEQGCFHCHGSWGQGGINNPGGGKVPSFRDMTFLMSMNSEQQLKEWIMDGATREVLADPKYEETKKKRAVVMPAYRDLINDRELSLLVAFYNGISGTVRPVDQDAADGYEVARDKGCFSCHGIGGRFDMPNPGSLVGRIPAWQGEDFHELARDEEEIREWILDGAPKRLREHPVANWFVNRQTVKMPAYRNLISDRDLDLIVAYINWLRDPKAPGHLPSYQEPELMDLDEMPY